MIRDAQATGARRWSCLLGLLMTVSLAGCASWTSPTPPSTAFDDDATACQVEVMQAAPIPGSSDANQYDAYIACLLDQGCQLFYNFKLSSLIPDLTPAIPTSRSQHGK